MYSRACQQILQAGGILLKVGDSVLIIRPAQPSFPVCRLVSLRSRSVFRFGILWCYSWDLRVRNRAVWRINSTNTNMGARWHLTCCLIGDGSTGTKKRMESVQTGVYADSPTHPIFNNRTIIHNVCCKPAKLRSFVCNPSLVVKAPLTVAKPAGPVPCDNAHSQDSLFIPVHHPRNLPPGFFYSDEYSHHARVMGKVTRLQVL